MEVLPPKLSMSVRRREFFPMSAISSLLIVGGGAGGAELAASLGGTLRGKARVTLVDRVHTHLWKPRLHEVAAGVMRAAEGEVSYAAQAARHGYAFAWGTMEGLDVEAREVHLGPVLDPSSGEKLADARCVGYDTLVLALGSEVNDFGTPGVAEHCYMLDSAAQAEHLQQTFLGMAFQVHQGVRDKLRVAIVGAGSTGVELAAEVDQAVQDLARYGLMLGRERLELTVLDMADRVLPAVDKAVSDYAQRQLEQRGIRMMLGQKVTSVEAHKLTLGDDTTVPADLVVWASGIKGHDMVTSIHGLTLNKRQQIEVDATLRCKGQSRIFAFGDCAHCTDLDSGSSVPATAQAAHQQAKLLARSLPHVLRGKDALPFHYRDRGTVVSLGQSHAAGEFAASGAGGSERSFHGRLARLIYAGLYRQHQAALFGWPRTVALALSDRLRSVTQPPVKLH